MKLATLSDMQKSAKEGFVREFGDETLAGFVYSEETSHKKLWDDVSKQARGIVFERATGNIVARPFNKFFNLFEMPSTEPSNLPDCPHVVEEKIDGSMGIVYFYNGKWWISTKGSLSSDQAKYAQERILSKYDLSEMDKAWTLITEIIYPANRIVLDYGNVEALRLLAVRNKNTGKEEPAGRVSIIAQKAGMGYRITYHELANTDITTLPFEDKIEGYVIRYENDFRVKVKNPWYVKIHRLLDFRSYNRIIDLMEEENYHKLLQDVPVDFHETFDDIYSQLQGSKWEMEHQCNDMFAQLKIFNTSRKDFAEQVMLKCQGWMRPFMFTMLDNQPIQRLIFKRLRGLYKENKQKDAEE